MAGFVYFLASEQQARELAANAVSASIPVGENIFYAESGKPHVTWRDITVRPSGNIQVDFHKELQVHLIFERVGEAVWRIPVEGEPSLAMQSWAREFPTWEDLICSVVGTAVVR